MDEAGANRLTPAGWKPEHMLLERIGRLASIRLQERFITNASVANYYVVEELLDDASAIGASLLSLPGYGDQLSVAGREALEWLDRVLLEQSERVTLRSTDLVHEDASWLAIREAARECLAAVGFDLAAFESREMASVTDASEGA